MESCDAKPTFWLVEKEDMKELLALSKAIARLLIDIFRRYRERLNSLWFIYSGDIEHVDIPEIKGRANLVNLGRCKIGRNFLVRSGFTNNPTGLYGSEFVLIIEAGAKVIIGNDVGISNSTIYCRQSITIGNGVLIGTDCKIYDTDFHSIHHADRATRPERLGKCAPVSIGNDVFIGTGTIILKGVTVGDRSVIGAGSLVSSSVPADELWAGNPAKKIRMLT